MPSARKTPQRLCCSTARIVCLIRFCQRFQGNRVLAWSIDTPTEADILVRSDSFYSLKDSNQRLNHSLLPHKNMKTYNAIQICLMDTHGLKRKCFIFLKYSYITGVPSLMSHSMSMLNRLGPIARMIFNCSLGHKFNETLTVLSSNPTIEGVFQNRICGFFIYIVSM